MLTDPKLRSQVDALWDKFWTGGLANPLDAIEQFSYFAYTVPKVVGSVPQVWAKVGVSWKNLRDGSILRDVFALAGNHAISR